MEIISKKKWKCWEANFWQPPVWQKPRGQLHRPMSNAANETFFPPIIYIFLFRLLIRLRDERGRPQSSRNAPESRHSFHFISSEIYFNSFFKNNSYTS